MGKLDELCKLDELKDELYKLAHTCNKYIKMSAKFDKLGKLSKLSWLSESGKLDELKNELTKLDELKDDLDELLSWGMSWVSWLS